MGLTRQGGFPLVDVRGQANLLSFLTSPSHPGPLFSFLFVFFIFFSRRNSNFYFNTQPALSCCHNNAMNLLHMKLLKIKVMMIMRMIYQQTGNALQDGLCSQGAVGQNGWQAASDQLEGSETSSPPTLFPHHRSATDGFFTPLRSTLASLCRGALEFQTIHSHYHHLINHNPHCIQFRYAVFKL